MNTDVALRLHKPPLRIYPRVRTRRAFISAKNFYYPPGIFIRRRTFPPSERYFLFRDTPLFSRREPLWPRSSWTRKNKISAASWGILHSPRGELTRFFYKGLKFGDRDVFPGISLKLWLGYWNAGIVRRIVCGTWIDCLATHAFCECTEYSFKSIREWWWNKRELK